MERNGSRWSYTAKFAKADPRGVEQVQAEEVITAQLFDDYETYSLFSHARQVIELVAARLCPANKLFPVLTILELLATVQDYLADWQNNLEDHSWPSAEEAGMAGRELLLIVLYVLRPEYVSRVDQVAETVS